MLEWQRRAVQYIVEDDKLDARLSKVIINEGSGDASLLNRAQEFFRGFTLWNCFVLSRLVREQAMGPPWYREAADLESIFDLSNVTVYSSKPIPASDFGNELPDEAIEELEQVDIAIRFGFGVLKGDALYAPKHGVLSYHHGDFSEYRGGPAGFYEYIHNRDFAGVTVQQLIEKLDGGRVVATTKCDISDAKSLREVREKLYSASPPLLLEALLRLIDCEPPKQPESLGKLYTIPGNREVISYFRQRFRCLRS